MHHRQRNTAIPLRLTSDIADNLLEHSLVTAFSRHWHHLPFVIERYDRQDADGAAEHIGSFSDSANPGQILDGLQASHESDSLTFDEQCGAEKTMSAFAALASGTSVVYGNGDLDNVLVLSLEQVLIDLDLVLTARRFVQGTVVAEDQLALDAIKRVGPGGHFLEDEHTLRFLRSGERFVPRTTNRLGHRSSSKPQIQKAHEIVEELLSAPSSPVVSEAAGLRIQSRFDERYRRIRALA